MSKSKNNDLKNIFISSNMITSNGNQIQIPNDAQNLYLNSNKKLKANSTNTTNLTNSTNDLRLLDQLLGGSSKSKNSKSVNFKQTDSITESITESVIASDSDFESESDSASESNSEADSAESESDSIIEVDPNDEPLDEYEMDEYNESTSSDIEEVESNEDEKEDENEETDIIDTEYNDDINEIDETHVDTEADDCLYQYDDLIGIKDLDRAPKLTPKTERVTDPHLIHYEKVRILGVRSKQIAMGAKVMVKPDHKTSAIELAKYELKHKMCPLIVKRTLPDNTYELWNVSELELDNNNSLDIIKELKSSFALKTNQYEILIN